MPSRERVEAFIAAVVSGDHVGAISEFYHEDASMQEPGKAPRHGRDILMEHERQALARLARMDTHPPRVVLVDGDNVVVHWVFDAVGHDGSVRRLEERLQDHDWLASDRYTLADICNFAIANGMQFGFAEMVNEADTPGIMRWLARINARPAARRMFAEVPMERLKPKEAETAA